MDILLAFMLIYLCGFLSILFSILAWRLRNQTFFYLGIATLGIYLIYFFYNFQFNLDSLLSGDPITIIINLTFIGLPIFFLVKSQQERQSSRTLDGQEGGGAVTDEYLDEIINAPDEEIDYEDDLDLR